MGVALDQANHRGSTKGNGKRISPTISTNQEDISGRLLLANLIFKLVSSHFAALVRILHKRAALSNAPRRLGKAESY